jgi:hypothetical protein
MEMTWLETFQLLGLDLLAAMLLALVVMDLIDHALHSAWQAACSGWRTARRQPPARRPVKIGAPRHV